ncbi:FYVE and coiled-coil domain-containing protein 1-like [Clytia hemisphaerica]|uniref:FYVE and coiled-coil domain-containing protein 1 n=1 Tax=Clytia hemisphaerica TaxID=252671 RepID=A0A7M5XH16_9CNID
MSAGKYSPPERLIFDVQGLIAEIKSEYFSNDQTPLDDNDTLVHKLCVRLENILRYGAREKYSFMGTKKDYWNFINDSLPKDEIVKFVQTIQELKSNQGKGRALLRQALMEKCLADTLQRCAINERLTKEYYLTDSIFRNNSHLQTLVHSLYDLNAIDFNLPHKGYDLDRSFPSFARKTFGNEPRQRRDSTMSTVSHLENDPVHILSGHVINLASLLNSWYPENIIKTVGEETLSLKDNIEKVRQITSNFEKLYGKITSDNSALKTELNRVKEENLKTNGDYELRLKQLNERYTSLQNMDISATEEKLKGLYDKLVITETELTESKVKLVSSAKENELLQNKLEISLNTQKTLIEEKEQLREQVEQCNAEIERTKHIEHCSESTNKILEGKLSELQKVNGELKTKERELGNQVVQLDSQLKIRDNELESLKSAFEQSTGFVVGSFKELKNELNNQLLEKNSDISSMSSKNDNLIEESKSLSNQNGELQTRIETLEQKVLGESKKRDDLESIVQLQKQNLAVEMKHKSYLSSCMQEIWSQLVESDHVDGKTTQQDLDYNAMTLKQESFVQKLKSLQSDHENISNLMKSKNDDMTHLQEELQKKDTSCNEFEIQVKELQNEIAELQKNITELNNQLTNLKNDMESSQNEQVSTLSSELTQLTEEIELKSQKYEDLEKRFVELEMEMLKIKPAFEELSSEKENVLKENEELSSTVTNLTKKLEEMRIQHQDASSSLEGFNAKENSYRNEIKTIKQEMESLVNIKNQEIQSLKFEMSSAEMKYETAASEMRKLEDAKNDLEKLNRSKDEKITELESNVSTCSATFRTEKEAVEREYASLQKKFDAAEEKIKITEKEITFLKVQVAKIAKEKEEERATRINTFNKLNNVIEEKKKMALDFEEERDQLISDMKELKDHLVNMTKDKHELWQKKDSLEFAIRQKNEERWVDDKEAKQCSLCLTDFSLVVRKHHCRLCGNIFCNNCSNHWLKTAHSRKKIRACRACSTTYNEKNGGGTAAVDEDNSLSDTISVHSHYESFDQNDQSDIDSNPGNFEVLDSSSITKSGSFGPTEQITIDETTDEIKETIIPTPGETSIPVNTELENDAENEDASAVESTPELDDREKIELTVYAGKRCFVPLVVAGRFYELSWEFTSAPKDVGFGIAFKKTEEVGNESLETLVPFSRYMSHKSVIHGKMTIDHPGLYYLCFSNAYSRFTSKTIECFVSLSKCVIKPSPE